MKHLYAFLPLILALLLAACAPSFSAGDKAAYYDLELYPVTPSQATVYITKPPEFPSESIVYNLGFDCSAQDGIRQNSPEAKAELKSFKEFAATNPNIDIAPKQIRVQSVVVNCKNNRVFYKAANMNELLAFIADGGTRESFGARGNTIDFVISSGYRYPNLRIDYYSYSTHVNLEQGSVSAFEDRGAVVPIILLQDSIPQPVVFEGRHSQAKFNPTQQATLVVKRGVWDILDFNYSQGTLTWNRVGRRPY